MPVVHSARPYSKTEIMKVEGFNKPFMESMNEQQKFYSIYPNDTIRLDVLRILLYLLASK
jgi:hypothetical protein